jgi:molecular chaperone DnaK (HSP70)
MPRGQAELVTTFEVDANGLLKVSAQDRASGRKASISTSTINGCVVDLASFRYHQLGRPFVLC